MAEGRRDFDHCIGACARRAERASVALEACGIALTHIHELERNASEDDLFGTPREEIDFWWGVHAACGTEYRRVAALFWKRCPHV